MCGFSFFIWNYQWNPLIVPNVLQKRILTSATGLEFLLGQDRVVEFPAELPLQLSHGWRQRLLARTANDKKAIQSTQALPQPPDGDFVSLTFFRE